jgi:predicted nucleotidyltransferase
MRALHDLQLPPKLCSALQVARKRITVEFDADRIVLFGSFVEGLPDAESDTDLLIVLRQSPDYQIRDRITRVILDINLEYDVNLSELIVDRQAWDSRQPAALPIHETIESEGSLL